MVMARLLVPEDFGLQGMVVAFTGFLSLFRDAGLSAVTVQRETLTHEQVSTLFWINLAIGTVLAGGLMLLAPAIAYFYGDSRLVAIAAVSATSFFLNGASVQHYALLQRQMRFFALGVIEVVGLLISSGVGLVMALAGYGYWSLVGMTVTLSAATAIGCWVAVPWTPGPPKRQVGMRSMLSFGGTLTLNSLIVYVGYNTEKVLLGHFWGAEALGVYGRAYQLISLPSDLVSSAVSSVAYASLARLQHDAQRLERAFLRGYSVSLSMTIPTTVTCAIFADEIVRIMLGPKWTATVPLFRLMTPTIVVLALINPMAWFLISSGRAKRSLQMAFVIAPAVILGAALGVRFGPAGVAAGFAIMMTVLVIPLLTWAIAGTTMTRAMLWQTIRSPLVSGVAAAGVGFFVRGWLSPTMPVLLQLIIGAAAIYLTYFALLLYPFGHRQLYVDLFRQLRLPQVRSQGDPA
jgi:PST family polysaccharide transporter